jgi:predicted RNA-binding protein associated with RNAse of E/G family
VTEIHSGDLGQPVAGDELAYKAERLGDVLIERVIWRQIADPRRLSGAIIADTGYIWFRFWLRARGQIVERYYKPDGTLIGTKADVSLPIECDEEGCRAGDLLLDVWISPDNQVFVYNEVAFDQAARQATLSEEQVKYGEGRVRDLTGAIARGKFPPPLVRNWQIDLRLIGDGRPNEVRDEGSPN